MSDDLRLVSYDVPLSVQGYNDAYGGSEPREALKDQADYAEGFTQGLADRERDITTGIYGTAE